MRDVTSATQSLHQARIEFRASVQSMQALIENHRSFMKSARARIDDSLALLRAPLRGPGAWPALFGNPDRIERSEGL